MMHFTVVLKRYPE